MSENLVSIIIPAYNHEKFISQTIQSILNQTYNNFELLITDDCSKDKTYDTIKNFDDKRIVANKNKVNLGTVRTLNNLLKIAKGDYVAFCGSDDYWDKHKLEKQINTLINEPEYKAIFCQVEIIDENNKNNTKLDISNKVFAIPDINENKYAEYMFFNGNFLCQSSALLAKEAVNKIGLFNCALRQLHDYEYWMRLINFYKFKILPEQLVYYRRQKSNNDSISSSKPDNFLRVQNEMNLITLNFINKISDELFYKIFNESIIIKKKKDHLHAICEKYFVLDKWSKSFCFSNIPGIIFMEKYINDEKIINCLENDYTFNLLDFYKRTGSKYITYPNEYYENLKVLNDQYNQLINSRSWKITKPLRRISSLIK